MSEEHVKRLKHFADSIGSDYAIEATAMRVVLEELEKRTQEAKVNWDAFLREKHLHELDHSLADQREARIDAALAHATPLVGQLFPCSPLAEHIVKALRGDK